MSISVEPATSNQIRFLKDLMKEMGYDEIFKNFVRIMGSPASLQDTNNKRN